MLSIFFFFVCVCVCFTEGHHRAVRALLVDFCCVGFCYSECFTGIALRQTFNLEYGVPEIFCHSQGFTSLRSRWSTTPKSSAIYQPGEAPLRCVIPAPFND